MNEITEVVEGKTKILVPIDSVNFKVPPKEPAFFNPRAKLNRDFSVIAYSAFWKNFEGPKIFLDGLTGLGARGLRVANELKDVEKVIVNDLNPKALELCVKSANLNKLKNFQVSENGICKFFSSYSTRGKRASIVDIDPFGSPAKYLDCGIRTTMHNGLLSMTATDMQVLHGLFQNACKRRYYGTPVKTEYSNEIAIRLILGCLSVVADRLDITVTPLFVENEMHYYRIYVKILNRPEKVERKGYVLHCNSCGNRTPIKEKKDFCDLCGSDVLIAGPLWVDTLFDKEFVRSMLQEISIFSIDKKCSILLEKCLLEADMPALYFTQNEIASRMKTSPLSLEDIVTRLQHSGYRVSPTSLNPTGFRTNCKIVKIMEIFKD